MNAIANDAVFSTMNFDENGLTIFNPEYTLSIGWAEDYDRLVMGDYRMVHSENNLGRKATQYRRVLLHAEGGSGKTAVLCRLHRAVNRENTVPVFLSLENPDIVNNTLKDILESTRGSSATSAMQQFVDIVARDEVSLAAKQAEGYRLLLLVDGLNEISPASAELVLKLLERYTEACPRVATVVTDRFTMRQRGREGLWRLASLLPMNFPTSGPWHPSHAGPDVPLQGAVVPFVADIYGAESRPSNGGARHLHGALKGYFESVFESDEVEVLSKFAYLQYKLNSSVYFNRQDLFEEIDENIISKIYENRLVREVGNERLAFRHQIIHDYLAACYVAADPELWNAESFDAISFFSTSHDSAALVLAMLRREPTDNNNASVYIERLYDWNLYACLYALSRAKGVGSRRRNESTEFSVLATVAERQWDVFNATRFRVRDALKIVDSEESRILLSATNIQSVIDIVESVQFEDERFLKWKSVFCVSPEELRYSLEKEISNQDSIVGWAAANVLKRAGTPEHVFGRLRQFLQDGTAKPVVRWRCVHALGASKESDSVTLLFNILDRDADLWVRYGALRSLFEIALLSNYSERIFRELEGRIEKIIQEEMLAEELGRCTLADSGGPVWKLRCKALLGRAWELQNTNAGRERWKALLNKIGTTGGRPRF